jgi:hypothetical protein
MLDDDNDNDNDEYDECNDSPSGVEEARKCVVVWEEAWVNIVSCLLKIKLVNTASDTSTEFHDVYILILVNLKDVCYYW